MASQHSPIASSISCAAEDVRHHDYRLTRSKRGKKVLNLIVSRDVGIDVGAKGFDIVELSEDDLEGVLHPFGEMAM